MKKLFDSPLRTSDGSLSFTGFFWSALALTLAFLAPLFLIIR